MQTGVSVAVRAAIAIAFRDLLINTADGSNVHLYQNDFAPPPTAIIADFTECDFAGYAPVPLGASWQDSLVPETGEIRVFSNLGAAFTAGAIVSPQTAYGFYVTDDANAVLAGFGRFDDPTTFITSGEQLVLIPEWLVPLLTLVAEVGQIT